MRKIALTLFMALALVACETKTQHSEEEKKIIEAIQNDFVEIGLTDVTVTGLSTVYELNEQQYREKHLEMMDASVRLLEKSLTKFDSGTVQFDSVKREKVVAIQLLDSCKQKAQNASTDKLYGYFVTAFIKSEMLQANNSEVNYLVTTKMEAMHFQDWEDLQNYIR